MKRRKTALAGLLLLCVALLFASCGTREFVKDDAPPTDPTSAGNTEPAEPAEGGLFTFASNIKMGMSIAEVQGAIGQVSEVKMSNGRKSFSNEFSGVFLNYNTTKDVIFMFDAESGKLEQMQFRGSTATDGANTADAIELFNARYGKQGVCQGNYLNRIWKSDDVYVILSEINENDYAVTYTEQKYFEAEYPEETAAYKNAR